MKKAAKFQGSVHFASKKYKLGIAIMAGVLTLTPHNIYASESKGYINVEGNNYQGEMKWAYEYTASSQSFITPVSGTYQFEIYGAQGSNYESYSGGYGGSIVGYVDLYKGDQINIIIGGTDGYNGGGIGTLSNGGGATQLNLNGNLLAIAGGGGGATNIANGNVGGSSASTNGNNYTGSNSTIQNSAGGGARYLGGNCGYTNYHIHSGDNVNGGECYGLPNYHAHSGDEKNGDGCYSTAVYHVHDGESTYYGGCYTNIDYHEHDGDTTSGGGCYTQPLYHTHNGNRADGGQCYAKPVYHTHNDECPTTSCTSTNFTEKSGWYYCNVCGGGWSVLKYVCAAQLPACNDYGKLEYYQLTCTKSENDIVGYDVGCGMLTTTPESYSLACDKDENTIDYYELACGLEHTTIMSYQLSCSKTEGITIESSSAAYGGTNYYDSYICNQVISNAGTNFGNGKASISLVAVDGTTISYYSDTNSLLSKITVEKNAVATYPLSENPTKSADEKYSYTFIGWDNMSTDFVECLNSNETVQNTSSSQSYRAVYQANGQSYTLIFDNQSADSSGSQSITVTYGSTMQNIEIPTKSNYIFAGYYTEPQGMGVQYYNSAGIPIKPSNITSHSTLYAYWVQPLNFIKQPLDVSLKTGYRGVTVDIDTTLLSSGDYSISYQWYKSDLKQIENAEILEGENNKTFIIPENCDIGEHYFFCEAKVIDNTNMQQFVCYSEIATVKVDKGNLLDSQITINENNIIYDGMSHKAMIDVSIGTEDVSIYYSKQALNDDNYNILGQTHPLNFTEAGNYDVYYYISSPKYNDYSGMFRYIINKATPSIYLIGKNVSYTGEVIELNTVTVKGVNETVLSDMKITYMYYTDETCTQKTTSGDGAAYDGAAPSKAGSYYVMAYTEEISNYVSASSKIPALLNILNTTANFEISGYTGIYDQKEHSIVTSTNNVEMITLYYSIEKELTLENYKTNGTTKKPTFKNAGNYTVHYMIVNKLSSQLNSYISGSVKVIISKANQYITVENSPILNTSTYKLEFPKSGNWEYKLSTDEEWQDYSDNILTVGTYEVRLKENENYNASSSIKITVSNQVNNNEDHPNSTDDKLEGSHIHDYILIEEIAPTNIEYGKLIYCCAICKEELIILVEPIELPNNTEESVPSHSENTKKEEKKESNTPSTSTEKESTDNNKENIYEEDGNGNGIPDIFEDDNNKNGIPDYFEWDMNNNGIPDYKEDANNNGIPDFLEWQSPHYNVDIETPEIEIQEISVPLDTDIPLVEESQFSIPEKIMQTVKDIVSKENVKIVLPCVTLGMVIGLFVCYAVLALLSPIISLKSRYKYYIETVLSGKAKKYTVHINTELAQTDLTREDEGIHIFRRLCRNEDYIITIKDKDSYSVGIIKITFIKKRIFHEVIINRGIEIQIDQTKNGAKLKIR